MTKNGYTDLYNTIKAIPLAQSAKEMKLSQVVAGFICVFGVTHILAGLLLYYANLPVFLNYVNEDGYIEYLTAFFLLLTSFYCMFKSLHIRNRWPSTFFGLLAILFFFGFGEEISWGQRLFGFETPEELKKINTQQEFNVHNIMVEDVKLNKLIFGKILYVGLFFYFLGFNFLYKKKIWFRKLIDKTGIPLPAPIYSLLFLLSVIGVQFIQHEGKWELDEFAVACFAFLCFLQPFNKNMQQRLAPKTPAGPPEYRNN
jgi:hypothetical protein